jgi:hypothetical protein
MNLSTARSEKRAKEVGIRKTLGSVRTQLIGQFLSESLLVALLALFVALALTSLSLPFFNSLADKQMFIPWTSPTFWLLTLGFTFFTGLISGSYPAFYLSGFEPIKVLKGTFRIGRFAAVPRKNFSSCSIYCFGYAYYWNHHRIQTNSTCKEPAGRIQP